MRQANTKHTILLQPNLLKLLLSFHIFVYYSFTMFLPVYPNYRLC